MFELLTETRTLQSGYDMPVLGLGTWQLKGDLCEHIVAEAIDLGYRAIDTAEIYENEAEVGRALERYPRNDLFITSKVSPEHLAPANLVTACRSTLERLGTAYVDLYLIHWPNDAVALLESLAVLHELVQLGWIRSIGVSNFDGARLSEAIKESPRPICVNQIEYHPYARRCILPAFCAEHDVVITAYSPLAQGKVLEDPVLLDIGAAYDKSPAQISLKWLLQQGHLVIPKASTSEHLRINADLDGWVLSPEDMERIAGIEREVRVVDTVYT